MHIWYAISVNQVQLFFEVFLDVEQNSTYLIFTRFIIWLLHDMATRLIDLSSSRYALAFFPYPKNRHA